MDEGRYDLDAQSSYDRVATEYAERFNNELDYKPHDRALLDRFAQIVIANCGGLVCDIGCGPGHVAQYLADRGVDSAGLDLSPEMVEGARKLHPALTFHQGDMRKLPFKDGELAAITAFYSIIHIPRDGITETLREWRRALRPAGRVLLAFHVGEQAVHLDEWWGETVNLDFMFFTTDEMRGYLEAAGFTVEEAIERPPYEQEHPSTRAYILARTL